MSDMQAHVDSIRNDPEYRERWFAELAQTVAVDFDGVLHPYSEGWIGFAPADEPPAAGALEFLQQLNDDGYRVVVFSTRCESDEGLDATTEWLRKHGLLHLIADVTCKKVGAVAYVDDRAVVFRGSFTDARTDVDALAKRRPSGAAR